MTLGYIPPPPREKQESGFGKFEQEWRQFYATDDDCYRAYLEHCERRGIKSLRQIGPDSTEVEIQRAIALGIRIEQLEDRIRTEPGDWILASDPLPDTITATDLEGSYQTDRIDPRQLCQKRRKRKGIKGITSYGARMVRSACHILQQYFSRNRLGFLTLTLPDHPDYLSIWVCQWAEIVRKFTQELKRELERQGAPSHVIAVTEIQTARSKFAGFPIPHLHACYVAWDGKTYIKGAKNTLGGRKKQHYISHAKMQAIFARVLANEVERMAGEVINPNELNPRVEVKAVRKSAEGYLGKYMSKGGKDVRRFTEADPKRTDLPTHWWHCSKELRKIVLGLVTELPSTLIELIVTQSDDLQATGIVQYMRTITRVVNDKERILAWAFRFAPDYNPTDQNQIALAFGTS
ncbi:hypothetical protein IQ219_18145 [Synechocystis sp. LEGE 06083]|uniref:hypothetical protein n=1 Tax=Synechocystis sp. LEGE 06083 TaxID=915336 RepID=UPI00187EBFE2|nr:hypothetical protein [Synechocystis sp. LEGE 06083]MBE9197179.1 hypothetical protein [Synechocystis sp. LEGE 06083]